MSNKLPNATAGMTFPRPKPDTPPSMVFVNRAIDCQMKRDNAGGPQEAAERRRTHRRCYGITSRKGAVHVRGCTHMG